MRRFLLASLIAAAFPLPAMADGLFCMGGGDYSISPAQPAPNGGQQVIIGFRAAQQPAKVKLPRPGECAWGDRIISIEEPHQLSVLVGLSGITDPITAAQQAQALQAGITTLQILSAKGTTAGVVLGAVPEGRVMRLVVLGGTFENKPPPATADVDPGMDDGDGQVAVESDDCPAGSATVTTPPGLAFLNVREKPNGKSKIVAQVKDGSEVEVAGACIQPAAGFAKQTLTQKPNGMPAPGSAWCRISAPKEGCVAAEFLAFGDAPLKPAAGLAKTMPKMGGPSFSGSWTVNADDDVSYTLTMKQKGNAVVGGFLGADGSAGTFNGQVMGKVLRFAWKQADGTEGSGKFALSDDGGSFDGSYNFGSDPEEVEGTWAGTRN